MTQSTALPSAWINRLFDRFAVMYGKHWLDLWADVPMADVKDAWRTELGGCTGEQIGAALKACGTFPPTLPEFLALCKPAPVPAAHRLFLPAPPRNPNREIRQNVKEEIDKLLDRDRKRDPKDWARGILRDAAAGTYTIHCGIQMAKQALEAA